jgi:hypothetical protein
MNKQIIHFGQDLDKPEFYNLIVKVADIGPLKLSDIKTEIHERGFTIYHIDEHTIEAAFKNQYMEDLNKFEEFENEVN